MYVVIEIEPYGSKPQIERVYGPFSEQAAREFVRDYCRHHEAPDAVNDGVLRIEKLAGTKL